MQTVAAYLLERRDGMESLASRAQEASRLKGELLGWLGSKGGDPTQPAGTYRPLDDSAGTYQIAAVTDSPRELWQLQLREETAEGRCFSADVSLIVDRDSVLVYATLEGGWTTARIMPVSMDPRCPRVVRNLIDMPGHWYHGASRIRRHEAIRGFDAGEVLAEEIRHPDRTLPIVAVSLSNGQVPLRDLDAKVAFDLAGLANVVTVDEDASWALTDILGQDYCCYWGAVRLYWPRFSPKSGPLFHPLWTAARLQGMGHGDFETREAFRDHLRRLVFRAAVLGVRRPAAIDGIQDATRIRVLSDLTQRASSLADFKDLADSYAEDNDLLRKEREALRQKILELQKLSTSLESECAALQAHLAATKGSAGNQSPPGDVAGDSGDVELLGPPIADEVRFYKKTYSRPGHDVMIRVRDCGCNSWEGAHAADKARKGIGKLEGGRTDWKTMQHCASCTGGGMWKVRW